MSGCRPRVFYGWWIVLIICLGLCLGPAPIIVFSFGVFLRPLTQEFHSGRGGISLAFTFFNLMNATGAPLAGRLTDRYGARKVILPCTVIFGSILLSSKILSAKIWQLYLFYTASGLVTSGTVVPYVDVVSHWFDRHRGLALGLMTSGLGAGAMIMPSVVQRLILVSASLHACFIHMAPMLTDRGLTPTTAALASSVVGMGLMLGRVACGYLLDRFFAPYVAAFFFGGVGAGIVSLWAGSAREVAFAGAFLVGLGVGAEGDIIAYLTSRYFGLRSFGEIYGYAWSTFIVAGALGAFLMGAGFDFTGSYASPLMASFIATLLAAILITRLVLLRQVNVDFQAAWRTFCGHEYPTAASLCGSAGRVLVETAGWCGTLGAPTPRLAVCARAAAGWGPEID